MTSTPAPAEKPEKEEKPEAAGSEAPVSGETKTEGLKEEAETTPAPAAKAKTREKNSRKRPDAGPHSGGNAPFPWRTAEPVPAAEEEPTAAGENAGLWTAVLQVRSLPGVDLGSEAARRSWADLRKRLKAAGTAPEESYPDSGNSSAQTVVTNGSVTPLRPAEGCAHGRPELSAALQLKCCRGSAGEAVFCSGCRWKRREIFSGRRYRGKESNSEKTAK